MLLSLLLVQSSSGYDSQHEKEISEFLSILKKNSSSIHIYDLEESSEALVKIIETLNKEDLNKLSPNINSQSLTENTIDGLDDSWELVDRNEQAMGMKSFFYPKADLEDLKNGVVLTSIIPLYLTMPLTIAGGSAICGGVSGFVFGGGAGFIAGVTKFNFYHYRSSGIPDIFNPIFGIAVGVIGAGIGLCGGTISQTFE